MHKSLVLCEQARKHLQTMKAGDKAFFYHSNCKQPGIAGIVEVSHVCFIYLMYSTHSSHSFLIHYIVLNVLTDCSGRIP